MMIDNMKKMKDNELDLVAGGTYIKELDNKELFTPHLTPDYSFLPIADSMLDGTL